MALFIIDFLVRTKLQLIKGEGNIYMKNLTWLETVVRQRGILDFRHRDVLKKEALFHGSFCNNLLSIVCIQKRDWFYINSVAVFM